MRHFIQGNWTNNCVVRTFVYDQTSTTTPSNSVTFISKKFYNPMNCAIDATLYSGKLDKQLCCTYICLRSNKYNNSLEFRYLYLEKVLQSDELRYRCDTLFREIGQTIVLYVHLSTIKQVQQLPRIPLPLSRKSFTIR